MALVNTNQVTIAGTNHTLDSTFIVGTTGTFRIPGAYETEFTVQIFVYETSEKWLEDLNDSGKNMIRIPELIKNNSFRFVYNRLENGDIFEYFDIKMKERLIEIFPSWNPDLITYIPPHSV